MEENKFEKQVRQKMDDLKMNPSDNVWEYINKHIDKRKNRKWIFLFLLTLFVALLSGSYWYFNSSKQSFNNSGEASNIHSSNQNNDSAIINKNKIYPDNNNEQPGLPQKSLIRNFDSKKGNNPEKNIENAFVQKNVKEKKIKDRISGNATLSIIAPQQEQHISPGKDNDQNKVPQPVITSDNIENKNDVIANKEVKIDHLDNIKKDSVGEKIVAINVENENDSLRSSRKENKNALTKNKWHLGLVISAGISHVGNQFLGLGYTSADYLQNASANPGSIISNPSKVKNAGGYIVGVFVERDISAKTKLSFGVNYKDFNTSNLVGRKNDSSGTYSSTMGENRYYNNFKFIEIPIKLRLQLVSNKTFPVFWNGGITISRLISSNALQFNPYVSPADPAGRAYYESNSLFNKTFVGFSTGLSTAVYRNQKLSVLFGPYFYYAASRLANEGLYNKNHFVFFGLHTELIFGKNNF